MGGVDGKSNRTNLTAREHFISHLLLTFMYPDNYKMKMAIWAMMKMESGVQRRDYRIGARQFERLRKEFCIANSISHKGKQLGKDNPFYGKKHSDEFIQQLRNKVVADETRQKMSEAAKQRKPQWLGKKLSEKHKERLRNNSPNSKRVKCVETDVIYRSAIEASKQCEISQRNLRNHCNGVFKTQRFEWVDEQKHRR
jgi:hypothetical protein